MRFRKNAVPVPVTRDLLQEKQTEVTRLARQAIEAVDIVTRTMNELEGTLSYGLLARLLFLCW